MGNKIVQIQLNPPSSLSSPPTHNHYPKVVYLSCACLHELRKSITVIYGHILGLLFKRKYKQLQAKLDVQINTCLG